MAITPLPTLNRSSTSFREDVDTFFGSQLPVFAAEANALQSDVTAKQSAASGSAATATTQATTATTKAAEALASAASATASAASAATQSATATTKAAAASTSEISAATNAASALASKNAAALSATDAATSASSMAGSVSASATSATSALASKNAAALSATDAATSATGALALKNAAVLSATDAATSATASHASDLAVALNALAAQSSSDAALASMLTAINYLTTAQALISVPSTNLAINILGSAIMKPGSVFYSVGYGVPAAYVTYTAGVSQWNVSATNATTGITDVAAARSPASVLRAKGKVSVIGSGGTDTVFVEPGAYVDFTRSGLGVDTVYLQGNFAEYSFVKGTGTMYTASRILVSGEQETVIFNVGTSTSGGDKLVFKNGYVQLDRAFIQPSGTALYDGATYRLPVAGDLNAAIVTPTTFPADAILVDTNSPTDVLKCNGAAVSRSTYPYLFLRIGTSFGAGDGSTTFNLPTVADLAAGVSAYIKA